jgi:predicted Zn-dependent protease
VKSRSVWGRKFLLLSVIACVLLLIPFRALADDPSWYERYLVNVICESQYCLRADQVPRGLVDYLDSIYRPLKQATSIDERITLLLTAERSPNAWALKHYTGITAGLVLMRPTRDELAFVVAHELAHIELGHYQRKLEEVSKYYALAAIGLLVSQGKYNAMNDPFFVTVARIALGGYSRNLETEADLRGIRIAEAAGFDPRAAITALLKIDPLGLAGTGDLFDDHPSTAQRIARIRQELGVP